MIEESRLILNSEDIRNMLASIPIKEIGLSVRSVNVLSNAEICTVGAMMELSVEQLSKMRNLGTKSINEIDKMQKTLKKIIHAISDTVIFRSEENAKDDCSNDISNYDNKNGYMTSTSIKEIDISVRSVNALWNAKIYTVSAMLELSREQLFAIKNLGVKSINEIQMHQKKMKKNSSLFHEKSDYGSGVEHFFFHANGNLYRDILLKELMLSYRTNRILTEAGYKFASELLEITEEGFLTMQGMGKDSANEILSKIYSVEFEEMELNSENREQAEEKCLDFISSFMNYIYINPTDQKKIFRTLLPYFRSKQDDNILISNDLICKEAILRKQIENKIVDTLKENPFGISRDRIDILFPAVLVPTSIVSEILYEMELKGKVSVGENVKEIRGNLWEYINSIEDIRQREILKLRLKGKTLKEIGALYGGLTRERVRQIIRKSMRCKCANQTIIEEDKYREIFETYSFSKEEFLFVFDIDDAVYVYLSLVCEKKGDLPIKLFIEDSDYPFELRKKAEYVTRNAILIDE